MNLMHCAAPSLFVIPAKAGMTAEGDSRLEAIS